MNNSKNSQVVEERNEVQDKRGTDIRWYDCVLDDWGLNPHEHRIYLRIARRAGGKGICFEGIDNIAHDCRMNRKTVMKSLKSLKDLNLISQEEKTTNSSYKTNIYTLTPSSTWKKVDNFKTHTQLRLENNQSTRGTGNEVQNYQSTRGTGTSPREGHLPVHERDIKNYPSKENQDERIKDSSIISSPISQHPDPELGGEECSVVNDFSEELESSQEGVQNPVNVQTHTEAPEGASEVQISVNENTDGVPLEVEVIESYDAGNNQKPSTALAARQEATQSDAVDVEVTTIQNSGGAATGKPIEHDSSSTNSTPLSSAYGGTTNQLTHSDSSSSTTDSHSLATNNTSGVGQTFRPHKSAKNPRTGQKYHPWEGTVLYRNRWVSGVNPEFIAYVIMRNKNAKIKHFMSMKGSELIRATEKWMGPRTNEVEKLWYDFVDGVDINSGTGNVNLKQLEFEANRAKRKEWLKNMA
ncbi:MAG: helix-turn-helix domain-containing protein [Rivularia sp. (in: cyanobacteria)]